MVSINDIIMEIDFYLSGYDYSYCYIGITDDPDRRLREHGVDVDEDDYIFCRAYSANAARTVEDYFLEKGMAGSAGGGSEYSNYVYVYAIDPP